VLQILISREKIAQYLQCLFGGSPVPTQLYQHGKASENSGVSLSLTKALVEANRAQFQIKTGAHSGTLVEVTFSHALARA